MSEDIAVKTRQIEEKIRHFFNKADLISFRPFVVFDEQLDCIRVVARDCSVTETRINELLTVLEDNYPEADQTKYVGFTIKGAKHFCITHKIYVVGPVSVSTILDKILKTFPEPAV